MTRVIAITNQKGGVGKTTTAINLSAALAELGHRTLLADMDPQAHTTLGMGVDPAAEGGRTLFHQLTGDASMAEVLRPTADERLYVAPAGPELSFADEALARAEGRDLRLKRGLEEVRNLFEFVVIDSPAQLNLLTINTMAAATEVLVPAHSQHYSQVGLGQLLDVVEMMRNLLNPELAVGGVLVTQYDRRSALHRRTVERLRLELGGDGEGGEGGESTGRGVRVYETVIPHGLRAQHAAELHVPVVRAFPKSPVAEAYRELAAEVVLAGQRDRPERLDAGERAERRAGGLARSSTLGGVRLRGPVSGAALAELRRLTAGDGQSEWQSRGAATGAEAAAASNGAPTGGEEHVDIRLLRTAELVRGCLGRGITRVRAESVMRALRDDLERLADAASDLPAPPTTPPATSPARALG